MPHRARPRALVVCLALALAASACGSQVDHDRIVAAAGTRSADASAKGSNGSTTGGDDLAASTTGGSPSAGSGTTGGTGAPVVSTPGSPSSGGGSGGTTTGGSTGGTVTAASGSPVTIGNIGTYSGVVGSIFPGGAAAVQAWAQSVNARGGLHGHPVRVVSADDGGDPARALSLARQMVEEQGAIAFIGNMMPLSLSGIRKYLESKSVPLIGGDVTLPDWIESPVIFPSGTDVVSISVASVNLLAEAGGKKLAILWCGESPSCGGLARAAEAGVPKGMTLAFTTQVSIVQTDFTTECLRAKQQGVDTIFVAADANTVIRVGRSCAQQGVKPIYGTASVAVGPQLADDPNMEGLIAPTNNAPWFDTSTPGGKLFNDAMRTYASGAPLSAPAASMFAGGLIVESASTGFSTKPTSAELLAGLRGLRNQTAQGLAPSLSFRNGGSGPIPCYFVVKVKGGHWTAPSGAKPLCL
jgi:branched-chain amino acid transport system substrate-binding protein